MSTLIVEINKEKEQWKMSSFYKSESVGHKRYSIHKITQSAIDEICFDIFDIFRHVDAKGEVSDKDLKELRKSASLLYEQVFSKVIKDEIRKTEATRLIFYMDENLVHIPWELLHDGNEYLSLRFAIGRVVLTSREIPYETARKIPDKLKMLSICDPTGDLKNAYEEAVAIRNQLDKAKKKVHVDFRTTDVNVKYTMKNMREYDLLHFAGHAKYDPQDASKSGWVLKDGVLTAEKIMTLAGSVSMPLLVFANACSSGETEAWQIDAEQQDRIFGLANAFLLAGVKHYIGTFWKVLDKPCLDFSKEFYKNVTKRKSIGEALKMARHRLLEIYGKNSLIWASYMLYGDPDDCLILLSDKMPPHPLWKKMSFVLSAMAILVAVAYAFYLLFSVRPGDLLKLDLLKNIMIIDECGKAKAVGPAQGPIANLCYGKKTYASSVENTRLVAALATDNDLLTRWASKDSDKQWIYVDLGEAKEIGQIRLIWQDAYGRSYDIQVSDDAKKWKTVWRTFRGDGGTDVIDLSKKRISARYIKINGIKRATMWGYSLWEFEVYEPLLPNVAKSKKAFALTGKGQFGPEMAVDGNLSTRWGSAYSDPQWFYIDLERECDINMINILWENAYAGSYIIQISDNAADWHDVCEVTKSDCESDCIYFKTPTTARYVRFLGLKRGTEWGYSFWEFEARGKSRK